MDARQLWILRELRELGSVTAVAEALLVTPSAVSQQLRLLQRSIPVPLTERAGRRVVLTEAGQALALTVPLRELRLRGSYEDAVRLVSAGRDRRGGDVERLTGRPAGTFARRAVGHAGGFR